MQQVANFIMLLHHGDEPLGEILGVRRHEAHAELALHGGDRVEQGGEVGLAVAVGVDVLPQKGDLLIPRRHERAHLFQNFLPRAALFPSAHIGNDAVGAEIVAAVGDVHPCVGIARAERLGAVLRLRPVREKGHDLLFAALALDEGGQLRNVVRSEYDVDEGEFLYEQRRLPLLLRHAAAHGDEHPLFLPLELFKGADVAERVVLRILADAAGVEYDDVRLLDGRLFGISRPAQEPRDLLRFVHVHLAAVSDDVIFHAISSPSR